MFTVCFVWMHSVQPISENGTYTTLESVFSDFAYTACRHYPYLNRYYINTAVFYFESIF